MRRPCLKIGDRVHFPGDPSDEGTVIERARSTRVRPKDRVIIEWDQKQPGADWADVDEATRRGRLVTPFQEHEPKQFVVRIG